MPNPCVGPGRRFPADTLSQALSLAGFTSGEVSCIGPGHDPDDGTAPVRIGTTVLTGLLRLWLSCPAPPGPHEEARREQGRQRRE